MDWYLRKPNGVEYGPAKLETLLQWAAEGRIAAEDLVSRDGQTWKRAADEPVLEIEWILVGAGEGGGGPYHLGVFAEWVGAGVLSADVEVINTRIGRTARLGDLLTTVPDAAEPAPAEGAADVGRDNKTGRPGHPEIPESAVWQALARERDALADECRKWRALHDELEAQWRQREEQLTAERRVLESEVIRLQDELERLRRELAELQGDRQTAATVAAESGDWSSAYHALAQAFRTLSDEMQARQHEVQMLREELSRVHAAAEERVRRADELAAMERRAADEARRALADIERAHQEVIRSLRELNDRYIRLRERKGEAAPVAPSPSAAAGVSSGPPPSPEVGPSTPPASAPSGHKIRLMR